MATELRNKLLEVATSFVDLWEIGLGVLAFLHLIAAVEIESVAWLVITIIPAVVMLVVNAWQHGVLRAEAALSGQSTSAEIHKNPIFKASLARLLVVHLVMNLMIFVYAYTKDNNDMIHSIPTNGIWTFVNVIFSLFLLLQIISGIVHILIACAVGVGGKSVI